MYIDIFTEMVLRDRRLLKSIWTVLLRLTPAQLMLLSKVKKKQNIDVHDSVTSNTSNEKSYVK